jgi:hypothetical protein
LKDLDKNDRSKVNQQYADFVCDLLINGLRAQ